MSIAEYKKLIRAEQIVKNELAKVQPPLEPQKQTLVTVEGNIQLTDEQFVEEKRKLRSNLSTIMPMAQVDELANDTNLITKNNIYLLNRTWDKFIKGVTNEFSNITFDTFRSVLSAYLRRLYEPNEQQAQLNKLSEIVDTLREQAATVDGLAPKVEQIIQILARNPISAQGLDNIGQQLQASIPLTPASAQQVLQTTQQQAAQFGEDNEGEDIEYDEPEVGKSKAASSRITIPYFKDNTQIIASGDRNKLGIVHEKLKNIENIEKVLDLFVEDKDEKQQVIDTLKKQLGETLPERNRDFLRTINPYVTNFKNFKIDELSRTGNFKTGEEIKKEVEKQSKDIFGYGMKQDKRTRKEATIQYGVLRLNTDKLKANILKLTYNNNNMVKEIPATKISDHFKNMVNDILNNKKYSEAKFNKLNDDEKLLYKQMLKKSRLYADLDVRMDSLGTPSIDKLKNEFQVVMGQIEAG
ncbi:MAG: hypothetical protein ACK5XN_06385, partial [Bacteroidota bacterium]